MTELAFPFAEPPPAGGTVEVAPGITWLRLALPFRLDHVNVYLLEDGDGTAIVDTGLDDGGTRAVWETLLASRHRPITRIIATHFHPDHVGLAGWLAERTGAALLMSQTEYLTALNLRLNRGGLDAEPYRRFYTGHGLAPDITADLLTKGQDYLRMVSDLPLTFQRLTAGEELAIGTRRVIVRTGAGHAPEQVMLFCPEDRLLLCADQVLARISPNISVQAIDPNGDPLGLFLDSLAALRRDMPQDVLVLPGHNLPFVGLHRRIDELAAHHEARLAAIVAACRTAGQSAMDLVPVVFRRPIDDPHQMGFAFGEVLAHINRLTRQGLLTRTGQHQIVAQPPQSDREPIASSRSSVFPTGRAAPSS